MNFLVKYTNFLNLYIFSHYFLRCLARIETDVCQYNIKQLHIKLTPLYLCYSAMFIEYNKCNPWWCKRFVWKL